MSGAQLQLSYDYHNFKVNMYIVQSFIDKNMWPCNPTYE